MSFKKNEINSKCTFTVAEDEEGKVEKCHDSRYCDICENCYKHCPEHFNLRQVIYDENQHRKAIQV